MGTHLSGNLVFVSSSSSGSERGGRGHEGVSADASSNGCPGTLRKTHHMQRGASPLADDDGDDDVRSTVIPPFPMSRIRRLIRNEGEIRTTQDAVFLINNALVRLLSACAVKVQSASHRGGFLGFSTREGSDNLRTSLGRFTERNFLSIFRFKTWWSTQWVGRSGSDLQMETQWLLLDVPELGSYALILPLVEGSFRSALHPGTDGHVIFCAESGSTKVKTSSFTTCAYVHVSDNPYVLMKEAYGASRVHLNTFRLLEEKSVPSVVDKFGWCTWDAFYLTVNPVGVWHGVKEFAEGGVPLRFLIIDDGWQSISLDGENPFEDAKNLVLGGTQMTARLYRFEECEKVRKYKKGTMLSNSSPAFDPAKPKMLIGGSMNNMSWQSRRIASLLQIACRRTQLAQHQ
ncbi:Stachyose synthase [Nymphaea thermarum]|nr:Stachyose synthase [Nymphaea thermarum]